MKEKLSTKIINEIRRPLEALCVKLAIKMNPLMKQRERKIPMKYGFKNLAPLCRSIGLQNKSIEQFEITYNNITFDCILDIGTNPFELMIGVKNYNFACIRYSKY